ncbi:MAG TPA: hypothetical protein DCW33_01070, partial [Proteobacteria bacterium]|nr:hypothetical protein [Pseudomonadota bacterium]
MTTTFNNLLNDYLANKSAAERLELLQAFNRATNKGQAVATGFTSRDIPNPAVLNKDIADEQKKKIRAFKEKENVTDRDEELTIELLQHLASKYTTEAHLYDGELWQNYARSTTLNKKTVPSALMEALTNAFYVQAIEEYGELDYVANNSVTSPYVDQINCYARAFKRLGMSYTRQIAPFFDTKQNKAYLQIRYKGAFGPRVEKMPYDKVAGLSIAQYKEHNELIEVGKSVEKMSAEIDKRSAELKTLLDDEEGKKCIFKVHENGYIYEYLNQQMNNLATSKALLATFPTMSAVENYKEQFAETMNDAADVMKSYTKSEGRAHTRQLDTINNELGKVRDALLHKMEESFTYEDIDAAVSTLPLSYEAVVRDVIFGSSKNFEENRSRSLKLSEFVKGIQDQEFKLPSTEPDMVTQLAGAFKARFQDVGIQTKDRESIRDLLQILADQPNSRELNDQIKAFQERLTAVMSTRGLDDNRLDRIITLGCYADLKPDPKKISDVENDIKEAMAVDIKSLDKCAYDSLSDVQLRRYFLDLPVPVQMAISIACGGEDHPLTDHQLVSLRIENVKDMISDRDNDFKRNYKQSPEKLLQIAQRANDVYTKYQEIGQPTIYNTNFEAIRERVEPVRKEIELLKSLSNDEWSKQLHANKSLLTGMKLSGSEINCGDQTVKITASLNQAIIQAAPGPLDFETDRTEAIKQSWAAISTLGNTLEHAYNLTNSEGKADYAGRAQDLNARIGVKTAPFVQTPTSALEADELIPTIAIEQEPLCLTIRDDINDVLKTDMKSIEVLLRQQSEAIAKEKKEIPKHLKDSGLALSYGDLVDIPYLDSGLTRRLEKLEKILKAPVDSPTGSDDDNPFLIADTQNTNGDAKVRSYASRARQRLETEKRKRAIEKFKNRPWRKIISEWFQGDVKPTKLDITGVRKAMMNSDQRDTEQYDKLYQDMSEINQLAELQRRGLLPNDTGLDFVEPFSVEVGEENNKLSKTIEAIKGAIGKGGNADARIKALENGEKTSNVVEEKLYSQYQQLEKTQTGIIKFHGAYQAYQESIKEYVQYLEALGSKQYSVGREQIANLLYQANCCVLGKGTKEQLTKALDEASHELDRLKDGTTIVNSLRELDTKAVNVLNKKEEVQQAYLTAICQDNQIEKDVKKSLEDYRNFRLNTDLDSVIRFVPKDSKKELQSDYRKLLNKERLEVHSKGFESLNKVIEKLQDNRENSNKSTVELTEQLQKAIDAASVNISLQAVKAVKDDHSGETENALEGLEALIKDALNALKAPKETLEKIKGVNEAIEENIKKNNVQSAEENIVALQKAFREMKEGEAAKLYQRFGSNKTLLRRLLPDDIPRGEYVGQTLQRMQNKHSNDSAFAKLEAHIDAYYKVPKFKKLVGSKYLKKIGSGLWKIPKISTKSWEDFVTKFAEGAAEIDKSVTRYTDAQAADKSVAEHIKRAQ